jgi:hypothetical protein
MRNVLQFEPRFADAEDGIHDALKTMSQEAP